MNGTNHACAFTAKAVPHFTHPMEQKADSTCWLVNYTMIPRIVYPPEDGHPSQYYLDPMVINFTDQTTELNHYAISRQPSSMLSKSFQSNMHRCPHQPGYYCTGCINAVRDSKQYIDSMQAVRLDYNS